MSVSMGAFIAETISAKAIKLTGNIRVQYMLLGVFSICPRPLLPLQISKNYSEDTLQ